MQFTREIKRLLVGLFVAFILVVASATYWAVVGPDTLLLREDNPRLFEAQAGIVRGDIVDRNGETLVTSVQNPNGRVSRNFLYPSMNSILGYYSLRYGVGGAEATYNAILRGDELPTDFSTYFTQDMLHRPREGIDVQLTLDLSLQQSVYEAMQEQKGAVVVLDVPSGAVRAILSLPSFDPNTLDANWQTLITAPENPFFNRVLQGQYQPGGILQTPLITAALIAEVPVNELIEGASQPIEVDNLLIECTSTPPADRLALSEAYGFGCPALFVDLYNQLGEARIQETFDLFRLGERATLPGFINVQPILTPQPTVTFTEENETLSLENILGQGELTLSPLDVAVMTAAIVNGGNAPQSNILQATRLPGRAEWQPVNALYPTVPITTEETSRRLLEMMRSATITGGATRAARSGMNIGGHTAIAYVGDTTNVWFTGFVITGANEGLVVALVLEDEDNPALAASIGGQILEAAFNGSISNG
jgi:penicillin-binding protein A